ncbi:EamA-like transporter family protein [compost metagenome]
MYIYGIMTGHVLQVAFGYFLSPLMSMAVSRLVFREPLSRLQASAIAMAALGVTLMAFELLSLESFPWIALVIGGCYSFYGIFKKKVPGDAVVIQSFEIMAMLPFAVIFLAVVHWQGHGYQFGVSGKTDYLLAATGLITVLPLWWYSLAAKKLPMVTLGFLQFVPPICNFLLAVFVYGEPVSTLKVVAFVAIWIALALFTLNSIGLQRAAALTLNAKTSGA